MNLEDFPEVKIKLLSLCSIAEFAIQRIFAYYCLTSDIAEQIQEEKNAVAEVLKASAGSISSNKMLNIEQNHKKIYNNDKSFKNEVEVSLFDITAIYNLLKNIPKFPTFKRYDKCCKKCNHSCSKCSSVDCSNACCLTGADTCNHTCHCGRKYVSCSLINKVRIIHELRNFFSHLSIQDCINIENDDFSSLHCIKDLQEPNFDNLWQRYYQCILNTLELINKFPISQKGKVITDYQYANETRRLKELKMTNKETLIKAFRFPIECFLKADNQTIKSSHTNPMKWTVCLDSKFNSRLDNLYKYLRKKKVLKNLDDLSDPQTETFLTFYKDKFMIKCGDALKLSGDSNELKINFEKVKIEKRLLKIQLTLTCDGELFSDDYHDQFSERSKELVECLKLSLIETIQKELNLSAKVKLTLFKHGSVILDFSVDVELDDDQIIQRWIENNIKICLREHDIFLTLTNALVQSESTSVDIKLNISCSNADLMSELEDNMPRIIFELQNLESGELFDVMEVELGRIAKIGRFSVSSSNLPTGADSLRVPEKLVHFDTANLPEQRTASSYCGTHSSSTSWDSGFGGSVSRSSTYSTRNKNIDKLIEDEADSIKLVTPKKRMKSGRKRRCVIS